MLRSDVHAPTSRGVLEEGLSAANGEALLVNPTKPAIRGLIDEFESEGVYTPVRLLVHRRPLKELVDDFLIASIIADLVETESLALRTLPDAPRSSLLLTEEFMVSLVDGGEQVGGLTTTEDSFVSTTYEYYDSQWRRGEEFSLRMPPLSHVRETLDAEIGAEAVEDFNRILDTLETARGDGDGLDEVTIALLVAANNGELLYDISRWGEDIQLASKATFSRTKNRLEEAGLIDTEKVPIDVGRPRLRLRLAEERLRDADIEHVADHAQSQLG
jgi:hypothetical protein